MNEPTTHFRIVGLEPDRFAPLFALDDAGLAAANGVRRIADEEPGFPCRVSLADAHPGEELVLVAFEHHPAASPYRASGPIFVRRHATRFDAVDRVPDAARPRLLSVRAYDRDGMLVTADVCDGAVLEDAIHRMFRDGAAYLHVHFARPGCFLCRVDRA
ncbi:MAG TPA: DUF1203 domain-containing protein [Haliangiales bacterium]|nr:DUF1203 domain-containing protein [Haliangiales bacterium]